MQTEYSTKLFGVDFPGKFTKTDTYKAKIEVGYQQLMSFYRDLGKLNLSGRDTNVKQFIKHLTDADVSFKGGTYENLFEPITDLSQMKQAQEKLEKNKVFKGISYTLQESVKIRRAKSQYDGDYDYDKRWDLEPYQKTRREKLQVKIVKLIINFSFSWYVDAKKIDEFGAFVSGVVNMLEKTGVMVDLTLRSENKSFLINGDDSRSVIDVKLKKTDEYFPIQNIFRTFKGNFYRRALFGLKVANAEFLGKDVCASLGSPVSHDTYYVDKDNIVYLSGVPSPESEKEFFEDLLKVLGKKGVKV